MSWRQGHEIAVAVVGTGEKPGQTSPGCVPKKASRPHVVYSRAAARGAAAAVLLMKILLTGSSGASARASAPRSSGGATRSCPSTSRRRRRPRLRRRVRGGAWGRRRSCTRRDPRRHCRLVARVADASGQPDGHLERPARRARPRRPARCRALVRQGARHARARARLPAGRRCAPRRPRLPLLPARSGCWRRCARPSPPRRA